MSNFEFLLILLFLNSIVLIGLVSISIKKKSPRILIKFFFLPVLASCLFGMIVQAIFQISEISNRQLAANIFLILWCLKSFSHKSIKTLLLEDFLTLVRRQISDKKYFVLLINIIRLSSFQIICFSSVFSLNYLSGFSLLSFFDNIGVILCLIGFCIEYIGNKQIKERNKRAGFFIEGSRTYVLHPNITGIIFFLTGLQILAFGGVGSEWSFIGLLIAISIIYKILIPKIEGNLLKKYPDYSSFINKMPKIFSFKKII